MIKNNKFAKYVIISLFLAVNACSQVVDTSSVITKTSNDFIDLNLGPKGGGTIDPKITVGQTVINFKEGDGVLLFNLNLSGASAFSTKDVSTNSSVVTTTASPSPTPTPTASASSESNKITKLTNQIYINNKKYTLDISSDNIANNKHVLNLTGLKKGDIVSLSTQVYDSKSQVVGKESVQNKEVKNDIESIDLNISVNININVEQKTEVNVSQVVVGPTINVIVPTPQSTPSTQQNNNQTQSNNNQYQPNNNQPNNNPPPPPPPNNNRTR